MPNEIQVPYEGSMVPAELVHPVSSQEYFNIYQLEDGAQIRIKLVVTGIAKLKGKLDQLGRPVYVLNSQNVVDLTAPTKSPK